MLRKERIITARHFIGLWHNFALVDIFENGGSIIRRALTGGVTHFDLANNYGPIVGSAEENFGVILKKLNK